MLELDEVTFSFRAVRALDGVSARIEEDGATALLGPNGSGKTTLLNVVTGFLKPAAGRIAWRGEDLTSASVRTRLARGLGRTFQEPEVFGSLPVRQNLELAAAGAGSARRLESDVLALLGLGGSLDEPAGNLSYGQRRSLGLAMMMQRAPALLMLDEPSSGLGHADRTRLVDVLKALRERGIGLWLIDHDLDFVRAVCEHAMVLDAGGLIAAGGTDEVLRSPEVVRAYLGDSHAS